MPDHESIKSFIQNTLGCRCPEDVLRTIDCRMGVQLRTGVVVDCALVVGRRLLVYVISASGGGPDEKTIAFYVSEGEKERDETGLNRFRLVIAADAGSEQRFQNAFAALDIADEKIHLHVISREENIFGSVAG